MLDICVHCLRIKGFFFIKTIISDKRCCKNDEDQVKILFFIFSRRSRCWEVWSIWAYTCILNMCIFTYMAIFHPHTTPKKPKKKKSAYSFKINYSTRHILQVVERTISPRNETKVGNIATVNKPPRKRKYMAVPYPPPLCAYYHNNSIYL